jgi:hypothetical protein
MEFIMKKMILVILITLSANISFAQWYRTTSIYGYEFKAHSFILNFEDTYFISELDSLVILKPEKVVKFDFDDITGKEIISTYSLTSVEKHGEYLFFGSEKGLFRYSLIDESWKFYDEDNSNIPDIAVFSVTSTGNDLIITNNRGGITKYSDEKFEEHFVGNQPDIVPYLYRRDFKYYKDNFIYISITSNLCSFKDDSITIIKNYGSDFVDYPNEFVSCSFVKKDDKLFFVTDKNRFFSYDGDTVKYEEGFTNALKPYDSLQIFSFYFDKEENLVAQLIKFEGVVTYNYLLICDKEFNTYLYDFVKDLNSVRNYYPMRKQTNGDLFMNSGVDFVSNGDPALSVETGQDLWLWNLYPNPVHDILNIEVYTTAAGSDNLEVNIYDIAGRHILSKHPEADFNPMTGKSISSIELDELERGFYIFTITNGDWSRAKTLIKR